MHHLGLTAMEVQFIKVSSAQRAVLPEEIGKKPRELPEKLIIQVGEPSRGNVLSEPAFLDRPLTKKSQVTTLNWLMAKDYNALGQGRVLARSVDIRLSLHAPYYVDLLNGEDARKRTMNNFTWSCVLAGSMGADVLLSHLGFYGPDGPDASLDAMVDRLKEIRKILDSVPGGSRILLGLEPNGHPEVLGSKREIMELVKKVPRTIPILNVPHLAVREEFLFDDKPAIEALLQEFLEASRGDLYLNFSGVDIQGKGTFRMTPVKKGMVRFENIAEVLTERKFDATVISSSPLMEHDAMYLRVLYERTLGKQFAKKKAEQVALAQKKEKPKAAPAGKKTAGGKKGQAKPAKKAAPKGKKPSGPAGKGKKNAARRK
ncbi:MAG: TIM barrel protein [Candidatus Thermoplasmatota archaeon]|nr:TIM barrel protein [Candidatus Thermoplasmatota archaeon]